MAPSRERNDDAFTQGLVPRCLERGRWDKRQSRAVIYETLNENADLEGSAFKKV